MAELDLNYIKTILRSVLTSCPTNMTIRQVLADYVSLEGSHIPYKELGFKTIFELLETMKDVLQMPYHPNMNSIIKLVVDDKSSHLRDLVVNQKNQKTRKKEFPNKSYRFNNMYNTNIKKCSTPNFYIPNHISNAFYEYNNNASACRHVNNTPVSDYNASKYNNSTYDASHYKPRGYNFVKKKPYNSQKGVVTKELQKYIKQLCNSSSQNISIHALKNHLIYHPDYKKMNTVNIEEAIQMLKFFIYINKGLVYLKGSHYEIFSINDSYIKDKNPTHISYLQNIVDENEEMSYSNNVNDMESDSDYDLMEDSITNNDNTNKSYINVSDSFKVQENSNDSSNDKEIRCDTLEVQQENDNSLNISKVLNVKPLHNNTKLTIESPNDGNKTWILKSSEKDGIDYISLIISIIEDSTEPITVNNVMDAFQIKHGYIFPHKKFFCRTCMDFFRRYPSFFILDNQYNTNSIVRLNKKDIPKQKLKFRENITEGSIFKNDIHDSLEGIDILPDYMSKLNFANNNSQEHNNEKQSEKSIRSYEAFDSNIILDTMKIKMRSVLNKYKNGILCDEFMEVYANEYHSRFMFTDYGFKSMRDMAYKLPSVFYVKMVEERDECILYSTCRRVELESDIKDPSLFYKNIPRTVLNNLSMFFNKYRTGIRLDELMQLYCVEFGRSYEPLKYGYSSEKHMFESLYKMVRIQNNVLYTVDPFVYRYFVENNKCVVDNTTHALTVDNYLLNYTGHNVCSEKFQYTELQLPDQNTVTIVVAEIYNVGIFYLNLCIHIDMLNNFMKDLQCFYELNENKYKVDPERLVPGLACTSRFENSMRWHRAKILKIVNELNVKVLYVDYGSVEIIPKTDIRFLEQKFGYMPVQGIPCSLFEDNVLNLPHVHQMNRMFASLVDGNVLNARFNPLTIKNANKRTVVKLFLKSSKGSINVNKRCFRTMTRRFNQISVRRTITKMCD